jgi:hypothetical protein
MTMTSEGVPITLSLRVPDHCGDTSVEHTDVIIYASGHAYFSNGIMVDQSELVRDRNKSEVKRGLLKAQIAELAERLLVMDSSTPGVMKSVLLRPYAMQRKKNLERELKELE